MNGSMQCTLFGGDNEKCNTIIALKRVTASLSLVGCVFMISTIWLFRKYNVLSQRLILFLSIAALFDSIGYLMGDMTPDGPTCDFEGWWLTYFDWTVLMWVSCITYNLYQNVMKHRRTDRLEKFYHFFSWVIPPLLFSLLPLIGDNYGPAGAWCWIKHESTAWRFAIWYVPLFVIIIALFGIYIYIIIYLRKQMTSWGGNYNPDDEFNNAVMEDDIKVLKAYPFVYLALSIFPLILRIHNAATDEGDDVFALWVLTVLTAPLQGAVNAIVFGLDPETRTKLTLEEIQLAWKSRSGGSAIKEYPTVSVDPSNTTVTNSYAINDDVDPAVIQRQISQDKISYSSLN
ncbi:uncharacterized protein LOC143468932 [Clavelina lepadiformis]|uniref:G-protein coupled receptors family 2 profile 2 domain-containing protein n=1 Tax=Clavelina lepadiformis TaxID=159417 RepID=A0ABP0F0E5_CLALP